VSLSRSTVLRPKREISVITKRVQVCIAILALNLALVLPSMSQVFKTPPALYPSGASTGQWATVADVNNDGKPDVIVANFGTETGGVVGVLLGNGDGTFQTAVTYTVSFPGADAIAVEDLNGDGWPDLVVGTSDGVGEPNVHVLLNKGDGTFQPAVGYSSVGFNVFSVAVADVNGDGKLDLVALNECSDGFCNYSSVAVLLGNGDGTFLSAVTYNLASEFAYAKSLVAADINQDGRPDLLVADSVLNGGNGVVVVLLNKGDGTFPSQVTYQSGGIFALSVILGDVNGDGKLDAVVTNTANQQSTGSIGVLLGNGDGTFGAPAVYSAGLPCPASVAIGDFNGDGTQDLVVSSAPVQCAETLTPNGLAGVLLNKGNGTFQSAITYSSGGRNANSVAVADVNQDGKPDLVIADGCDGYDSKCPLGGGAAVLLGLPAKTTTTVTTSGSPSTFGQPVTFTATITATYGPIPNGAIVRFYDGTKQIGTGTTTKGAAKFTTSALKIGTHTIKATYPSSAFFKTSSGTVTQVVQ
jgi:Big-like domain-containing protein/VCBS repeat protein